MLGRGVLAVFTGQRGKVGLAGRDAFLQTSEFFHGGGFGELGRQPQQNVPGVGLGDDGIGQSAALLLFDDLQDVETGTTAHQVSQVACAHVLGRFNKQRWITVGTAQAHLATIAARSRRGKVIGQHGKVNTGTGTFQHLLGLGLQSGQLGRRGVFRHGHQNFSQIQRSRGGAGSAWLAALVAQVFVNLLFAHVDARINFALAQAADQQFVVNFRAKLFKVNAVGFQALAQLIDRDLVLAGDGLNGAVKGVVVNSQARPLRRLQLRLVADHALDQGGQEFASGRQGRALLLEQGLGAGQLGAHFVVGDGLGIDHGHDEICLLWRVRARRGLGGGRCRYHKARRTGRLGQLGLHARQGQREQQHQRAQWTGRK